MYVAHITLSTSLDVCADTSTIDLLAQIVSETLLLGTYLVLYYSTYAFSQHTQLATTIYKANILKYPVVHLFSVRLIAVLHTCGLGKSRNAFHMSSLLRQHHTILEFTGILIIHIISAVSAYVNAQSFCHNQYVTEQDCSINVVSAYRLERHLCYICWVLMHVTKNKNV
jgi:hypothetical protein